MATGGYDEEIGSVAVGDAMIGNLSVSCDTCGRDGKSTSVRSFCLTHKEYLCTECCKDHLKCIPGQHDINHFIELARNDARTDMKRLDICEEHGLVYVQFCQGHSVLCCKECCTVEHSTCLDVRPITQIATGVDDSFKEFEPKTRRYVANVNAVIDIFDKLKTEITKQGRLNDLKKEIDQYIQSVVSRIDKAKSQIVNDFEKNKTADERQLESILSSAERVKSTLEDLMTVTKRISVSGSDVEKFILNNVCKNKQDQAEAKIRSLTAMEFKRSLQWDAHLAKFLASDNPPVTFPAIDVNKVCFL